MMGFDSNVADAVPEAIYNELPPRLQKEVSVDHSRAPSLIVPPQKWNAGDDDSSSDCPTLWFVFISFLFIFFFNSLF